MSKSYRMLIENFLSIEEMNLDLSSGVSGFVGENAVGKTNVLHAVESILSGKHDTRLIKEGETRSEIRLEELAGDEVVASVSRIQTEKSNRLTGDLPVGMTPKRWLSTLIDDIAINPIRLISEDPVKYLKQHISAKVNDNEVRVFSTTDGNYSFDVNANSFDECDRASAEVATQRVATYKLMRHAQEVVDELRMELPPLLDPPDESFPILDEKRIQIAADLRASDENQQRKKDLDDELQVIRDGNDDMAKFTGELKDKITGHENRIEEIEHNFQTYCTQARVAHDKKIKQLEVDFQSQKNDMEISLEATISNAKDSRSSISHQNEIAMMDKRKDLESTLFHIDQNKNDMKKNRDKFDAVPISNTDKLLRMKNETIAKIKELDEYESLKRRYEQVTDKEQEYETYKDEYENLDSIFKWYKYGLPQVLIERAELPIENLSFREGELYVGDLVIDRLSTAERYLVAIQLAIALAKQKGHIAVCIDGIEIFDLEHRTEFMEIVKNNDIRTLYTRHGSPQYDHEIEIVK